MIAKLPTSYYYDHFTAAHRTRSKKQLPTVTEYGSNKLNHKRSKEHQRQIINKVRQAGILPTHPSSKNNLPSYSKELEYFENYNYDNTNSKMTIFHHHPPPPPLRAPVIPPPFPLNFPLPPLPVCNCHTYYQFYSCGCPDQGYDSYGNPVPSTYLCHHYFAPLPEQIWDRGVGFQHRNPNALPHSDVPRVLPFACFQHNNLAREVVRPEEVKARRAKFLEGRMNDPEAVAEVNNRIWKVSKGRRGKLYNGDQGVQLPGRGAIWPRPGRAGMPLEEARGDEVKRNYWIDRCRVLRDDPDAMWRGEEWDVDLDVDVRDERALGVWGYAPRTTLHQLFEPAKSDPYSGGAFTINESVINSAWSFTWGPGRAAELLQRATMLDTLLQM